MKKKSEKKLIHRVNEFAQKFTDLVPGLPPTGVERMPTTEIPNEILEVMDKRHALMHFQHLIKSLLAGDKFKAAKHAETVKARLRPTSNDYPFEVNEVVEIVRTEHGWEPGWTARITKVYTSKTGIHSYSARVIEDSDGVCDPFEITIDHTRDAHRR